MEAPANTTAHIVQENEMAKTEKTWTKNKRVLPMPFISLAILWYIVHMVGSWGMAYEMLETKAITYGGYTGPRSTIWINVAHSLQLPLIIIVVFLFVLFVRRLHDIGRKGWWIFAAWLFVGVAFSITREFSSQGVISDFLYMAFDFHGLLLGVCCFLAAIPSQPCDNKWGPYRPNGYVIKKKSNKILFASIVLIVTLILNGICVSYINNCLSEKAQELHRACAEKVSAL